MNKKLPTGFILLIVVALLIAGCFPSPPSAPSGDPYKALPLGSAVNISSFNGKCIYSMVSAQPASKPESNDPPSEMYPYTLITGAASSSIIRLSDETPPVGGVYNKKQSDRDLIIRQAENKALGSRRPQLSLKSGVNPAPPSPVSVGTTWNNINILDISNSWVTISATCRYISSHAYFFVDTRNIAAMEGYLADYGAAFDAIYNVNHTHFGSENDTDGNGKVIVIFSQELTGGLLGYFYAIDKYPKSTFTYSNEGDIFYMTTDADYQGDIVKGTLAHEFQHMIYFDEHYDRGVPNTYSWLNEALSQAAEYYNGLTDNHLAWIAYFLDSHWTGLSLTHWTQNNYGYGAIFIRYLIDQYGDTAIKNMCATSNIGVRAVESATGADFNTIYNNFTRALVMSNTGDTSNPLYNFKTLNLRTIQPNGRGGLTTVSPYSAGITISGNLYPYRLFFAKWTGSFGTMTLSGTGFAGTAFGLSY
ncbi:MAG: hypothetical protein K6U80_05635 [Firmicutes bacterium]|nr:hypothetical protein [Bacillota bacterium]